MLVISISGEQAEGKTTIINAIADLLEEANIDYVKQDGKIEKIMLAEKSDLRCFRCMGFKR